MTRSRYLLAALIAAAPALAFAQRAAPARPAAFEALIHCRGIADAAARLQCFDAAAEALQNAQERRDVVIVDRAQVREGRRRLFGLTLPSIPIFGGGNDNDQNDADQVRTVEGVVASVGTDSSGRWTIALQDGAVWNQADGNVIVPPRAGQHVVINRSALGSFMMRVNNQPGIRVRRTR